jgi:hypothetical protein
MVISPVGLRVAGGPVPLSAVVPLDVMLDVDRRERRAAEHVAGPHKADPASLELALNLVLLHRRPVAALATFDRCYEAFDVELVPPRGGVTVVRPRPDPAGDQGGDAGPSTRDERHNRARHRACCA